MPDWTRRATLRAVAAGAVGVVAPRIVRSPRALGAAQGPVTVAHTTTGSVVSFRVLPAGSRCRVTDGAGAALRSWVSGTGYASADTAALPAGTYTLRVVGSAVTCPFRLPLTPTSFDPAPAPATRTTVDRGAWTSTTTYAVDDVVTAGGRRWRAVASSSGAPPAGPARAGDRSRWTAADGS